VIVWSVFNFIALLAASAYSAWGKTYCSRNTAATGLSCAISGQYKYWVTSYRGIFSGEIFVKSVNTYVCLLSKVLLNPLPFRQKIIFFLTGMIIITGILQHSGKHITKQSFMAFLFAFTFKLE
jgi:hypothetical protein